MSDIAIYGGAFDPIHLGHQIIAQMIRMKTGKQVWFMPCYQHQFGKELTDVKHRWEMVYNVTQNIGFGYMPFDFEIHNEHNGLMYDVIDRVQKANPDTNFSLIIGSDNANILLEKWARGQELIEKVPFIIINRGDESSIRHRWYDSIPHQIFDLDLDISSTIIRETIADGDHFFPQCHLNPLVWKYIQENKLYGYKDD